MNKRATFTFEVSLKEINDLYKASHDISRAGPKDVLFGLKAGSRLVSALRLLDYDQAWLLRSVCTHPDWRHQGYATQLLTELNNHDSPPDPVTGDIIIFPLPHLETLYQNQGYCFLAEQQLNPALAKVLRQSRRRHKGIRAMVRRNPLR